MTRPITKTRALGTAMTLSPFVLLCELLVVPPVLVGAGELVELMREEGGNELLVLSSRAGGRAGRQGVHARGRGSRHRTAVAGDRAGTPRNLVAVRLSGLRRRGALSILISNGEPSRPEFLRRGGGGELVEIDGRVGRDLRAREYKLCFLGGVDCGDKHEGNHGNVVPSLELNLHILPLSSGVGTPLYRAVSSLLVGITRTRDSGCGVGPDQ